MYTEEVLEKLIIQTQETLWDTLRAINIFKIGRFARYHSIEGSIAGPYPTDI